MSFGQAVSTVLSKYATFSGRARRSEFWYWFLFTILLFIAAAIIDNAAGLTFASGVGWVTTLVSVFLILPNLAVQVRRLHDTGRSGWWWFIGLVPVIGPLILLYIWFIDSDGDNQYGPYPKD